jgi:anti-anti-sigma factor
MLHIQEKSVASRGVLWLTGRFDYYWVEQFKAALKKMEQASLTHLIVDLSEVPAMDSVSLGVLVAAHKRSPKTKVSLLLVIDPNTATGQVMSQTSLQTLMPTFHTMKEAISFIRQNGPISENRLYTDARS